MDAPALEHDVEGGEHDERDGDEGDGDDDLRQRQLRQPAPRRLRRRRPGPRRSSSSLVTAHVSNRPGSGATLPSGTHRERRQRRSRRRHRSSGGAEGGGWLGHRAKGAGGFGGGTERTGLGWPCVLHTSRAWRRRAGRADRRRAGGAAVDVRARVSPTTTSVQRPRPVPATGAGDAPRVRRERLAKVCWQRLGGVRPPRRLRVCRLGCGAAAQRAAAGAARGKWGGRGEVHGEEV